MYTKTRANMKQRKSRTSIRFGLIATLLLALALALAACSSSDAPDEDHAAEVSEEHGHEEEEHAGTEAHGIPEDAAAVPNPIAASEESVAMGAEVFATNCVACHGETGMGDGPSAAGLDPKPADLSEHHVQDLSDGALFYVVHNGVEGTAMPAWMDVLGEDDIWHVVNFLRTFEHD